MGLGYRRPVVPSPRACLGTCSLNGVLGLVRVSLMGSRGVHGVVEKVRDTAMKVN